MRLQLPSSALCLAGLLLPYLASAARSSSSVSKRDKFRSLVKNGVVELDSALYDELTDGPRDYSVSVVLTAMAPQYKCAPCQLMAPEHALVAKQWSGVRRSDDEEHFFAVLDFANGHQVFQRLGLQTAPTFQLFLPTEGPRASSKLTADTFDFGRTGFKAEAIAAYVRSTANLPFDFSRPIDKAKLLSTVTIALAVLSAIWRARPYLKYIVSSTYLWSAGTVIIILLMTSGYMWNQIRHPQYVQVAQGGRLNYVAGGYSNQLGAETHIVSVIYGILAFSAYTLAFTLPKVADPTKQRLGVYVWTGISVVLLGVLMNLFKIKQGAYPFQLF